jgi:hypothetical protein
VAAASPLRVAALLETFDAHEARQLLTVVNGSFTQADSDGQRVLRWNVEAGQTSELSVRREHPLFERLREFDLLQFEFRIARGQLDSMEVRTLGLVEGERKTRVHQWGVAVLTTETGVWHRREFDLTCPNWFPWPKPGGKGTDALFAFGALAVAPDTVIELRNVRLLRAPIQLKPFYDLPVTWPVKTENADGSVAYRMEFAVRNVSGVAVTVTGRVQSVHSRFCVELDRASADAKPGESAAFALTATIAKKETDAAPELYQEPLRVVFASASAPEAWTAWDGVLVRPLSKTLRRQVVAADADMQFVRERLAAGDAAMKGLVEYDRVLAVADRFLPVRLDKIPASSAHVANDLPGVANASPARRWQPGSFMPEIIDPPTGTRESDTWTAQLFWKEYLGFSGGVAENLGLAYQLTGDEKYARKAIELLMLYAAQYAQLPWQHSFLNPAGPPILCSSRVSAGSTYGSNWYFKGHCRLLAMIANSPSWTPEQRTAVYRGFVLPYATEIAKFRGGISNMTDITNHNLLLLGLAFDDAHLVRWATRTDSGLLSRLRDITDDGFSSEGRPLNYHFAAMAEYLPSLAYLERSGLQVQYPKAKLLAALRMPYRRASLTGRVPSTGDCGRGLNVGTQPLADHLLALFPDEGWLAEVGSDSTLSKKVRLHREGRQPDGTAWKKQLETKPRLFADAGLAVLRSGQTPETQIMVTLDYGRNPFHAALDRNQITVLAFGRVFTHGAGSLYNVGSGGITRGTDNRLDAFCSHGSLGHNLVVVDEQDQLRAIGRLLAWSPREERQYAMSQVDGIRPGVSHTRAVLLAQGVIVLLDRLTSEAEHTYDFAYHNFGSLVLGEGWTAAPVEQPLATTANYDKIVDLKRLSGRGPLRATWDLTDQVADRTRLNQPPPPMRLHFWHATKGRGQLFLGNTGMNNPNTWEMPAAAPSVFHRVKGRMAEFATVLEPTGAESRIKSVTAESRLGVTVLFTDGKRLTVRLEDLLKDSPQDRRR